MQWYMHGFYTGLASFATPFGLPLSHHLLINKQYDVRTNTQYIYTIILHSVNRLINSPGLIGLPMYNARVGQKLGPAGPFQAE